MTIAGANINVQLAFPQGRTKEDIEDRLNDMLTQFAQDHSEVVEFEVNVYAVDADPLMEQTPKRTMWTASNGPLPLSMR